jgi:hypothetical protein
MNDLIQKKVNEISEKHIRILEHECQKACDLFNAKPEDLIIEYYSNTEIKIKVQASHFKITNNFIFENGSIEKET